jgi:hypothetical protein
MLNDSFDHLINDYLQYKIIHPFLELLMNLKEKFIY